MFIYNMGKDIERKHTTIFRIQALCPRILYGEVLAECGGW